MPWFYAVAERDHALQNPISADKIHALGEHLRLNDESRVVDIACGRGGPALILAARFGCQIVGVERAAEFASVARQRVAHAGVDGLVRVVEQDATDFVLHPHEYDVALCLGASFIWGGLEPTLAALIPAVRPRGHVVVGEPFWRQWPLPPDVDDLGFTSFSETTRRFDANGLRVVGVVASSEDDWDTYESLHWRALEEWLQSHAGDPDADEIRRQHEDARTAYLTHRRQLLGWAIFIGWKGAA